MARTLDPITQTRAAINSLGLDDELRGIFLSGLNAMSPENAADALRDLEEANRQLPELLEMIRERGLALRRDQPLTLHVNLNLSEAAGASLLQNAIIPEVVSRIPSITVAQLVSAEEANVETVRLLANTAVASAERLTALNLNAARSVLEDTIANSEGLLRVRDSHEFMNLQTAMANLTGARLMAYVHSIYKITTEAQGEILDVIAAQLAGMNENVAAPLDKSAKTDLPGSDVAAAAVRAAIAAANAAYESVSKAAKQLAQIAEANVAASTATAKPVGRASARATTSRRKAN